MLGTNTVLKASRKKEYTVKASRIRIALDFSVAALRNPRKWSNAFRILRGNDLNVEFNMQTTIVSCNIK